MALAVADRALAHAEGPPNHAPSLFGFLWRLLLPEWHDIWVLSVFAAGIGLLALSIPITVESLVSTVQGGNVAMLQPVIVLAVLLLACLSIAGAMRAWSQFVVEYIQRRLFVRVVGDLAARLPRVKADALEGHHGPELVNRFFDVLTMQKAAATLLLDGLSVVAQGAIGLGVLAIWHPFLLGFNAALLVALVLIVWALGYGGVRAKIRESYAKYAIAAWLQELIRHPHTFKPADAQAYAVARTDDLATDYLHARRDSFRVLFRQIIFGLALQALASAALLGLGGWLVIRNELTLGQLVAAELIITVTIGSLVKLGKSLESFYDLMAAADKLGHLYDLPTERAGGEEAAGTGPVRLEGVNLLPASYGSQGSPTTFTLQPGERVALVGGPGSGKTNLLAMLHGDWEPSPGVIRLDGVDFRDLSLDSLRARVAAAGLCELFDGSVLDNITLGRQSVGPAEAREALRRVQLLDEVQRLPQGMNTRLVTGGAPLTRSQADRLMLARAIADRPGLLLVDGLLDGFDADLRRPILAELIAPDAPWTLLIVTNHPEVLAACGRTIDLSGADR